MSSIKNEQPSLLFTITNSLKYKFILHLLKEDVLKGPVSVYSDITKLFSTYHYKIPAYTAELVISNQTELFLIFISSTYFA